MGYPQQPGHALRMFLMSEVKSMACRNALRIVKYIVKAFREILMTLHPLSLVTKEKLTKYRIYPSAMTNNHMLLS